jgi:tetratricopeptide (TPR) repeat protein
LLCAGAGAAALWASQRPPSPEPAEPAPPDVPAAEVLDALPAANGPGASDRAIARWSEAARRAERSAAAWTELGDALMQKARETADSDYYRHAERSYRKALALEPRRLGATVGMAWVLSCRHEFEQSADWATKAVALDPRDSRAYGLLGDAAAETGDYDAALKHYQKMLDVRPDVSSYSRGAHLLYLTGDVRKATWLMGKALDTGAAYAENRAWCQAQLARMQFDTGALMAAEQLAAEAEGAAGNNAHVLIVRGMVKAARKDYDGAIDCYQKAAAVAPQHEALVALGDLYALTGKEEEAGKQYDLLEKIHQINKANGVRGDVQMARFYADHDRNLAEALRLAEEEYKTRKNVAVTDTLAWCLYKNERYEEAKAVSAKALAHKTPDASILYHSGMIYAKLGNRVAAQKQLYRALSINPYFHPIHTKLAADALAELGSRLPEAPAAKR